MIEGITDDPRSDFYALGVTWFELLVGAPPFSAKTPMALAMRHVNEPAPSPSALLPFAPVPAPVEALLARMLAKRPEDRPADARAIVDAIDALATASMQSTPLPALRADQATERDVVVPTTGVLAFPADRATQGVGAATTSTPLHARMPPAPTVAPTTNETTTATTTPQRRWLATLAVTLLVGGGGVAVGARFAAGTSTTTTTTATTMQTQTQTQPEPIAGPVLPTAASTSTTTPADAGTDDDGTATSSNGGATRVGSADAGPVNARPRTGPSGDGGAKKPVAASTTPAAPEPAGLTQLTIVALPRTAGWKVSVDDAPPRATPWKVEVRANQDHKLSFTSPTHFDPIVRVVRYAAGAATFQENLTP